MKKTQNLLAKTPETTFEKTVIRNEVLKKEEIPSFGKELTDAQVEQAISSNNPVTNLLNAIVEKFKNFKIGKDKIYNDFIERERDLGKGIAAGMVTAEDDIAANEYQNFIDKERNIGRGGINRL